MNLFFILMLFIYRFLLLQNTQLALFPGSPHVACLTLVLLAQNEEEKKLQVHSFFFSKRPATASENGKSSQAVSSDCITEYFSCHC